MRPVRARACWCDPLEPVRARACRCDPLGPVRARACRCDPLGPVRARACWCDPWDPFGHARAGAAPWRPFGHARAGATLWSGFAAVDAGRRVAGKVAGGHRRGGGRGRWCGVARWVLAGGCGRDRAERRIGSASNGGEVVAEDQHDLAVVELVVGDEAYTTGDVPGSAAPHRPRCRGHGRSS